MNESIAITQKYRLGGEDGGKPHDNAYPRGNPSSTGLSSIIRIMLRLTPFYYYCVPCNSCLNPQWYHILIILPDSMITQLQKI